MPKSPPRRPSRPESGSAPLTSAAHDGAASGESGRVVLGRILGAFGIQGWVRIRPFTESFEGLLEQPLWTLRLRGNERQIAVEECKPHGGALLAKLEGIGDRTDAEGLRGADVTVRREQLPAVEAGEYYWSDLIGLLVRNVRGVELGRIKGLIAAPAHDVLQVESSTVVVVEGGVGGAGEQHREQLIPFVEPILREVDLAGGSVTVDWEADY